MTTSSQTNPVSSVRVYALHEAPLPQTTWVDCDGNVWEPAGHTETGELLLSCPNPLNPEDAGTGPSFPWTLALVERAFGPLTPQADVQERRLVEVDQEFVDYFGPQQWLWKPWQREQYLDAIAKVHAEFTPGVAA
ncbi:phiSA1p31-related protein [Streptomyces sp. NPDC052015]|uniref:phiSA1p31-related protein n=1 Tax=Streptomyces sp. NPDC052015 TaxID=3154755 RepID=UPI003438E735